jgi:hypothetical protein
MPSPFPGMNPYLEQSDTWAEFHNNFILRAQEALAGEVGPNYIVKVEVRLILHEVAQNERQFLGVADVGVTGREFAPSSGATALLEAPVLLELPAAEVERHVSLEIRDRRNRRVVTVLELLSPSNKRPSPDRNDYLAKRREILAGPVHLVEIDLRRGGTRPSPPVLPDCDYYALVSRAEDRPQLGFWPIRLRDPLPVIPIPRDAPDSPVMLDLKGVLDRAYDAADYGKYIYGETPEPALSSEDQQWANTLIPGEV